MDVSILGLLYLLHIYQLSLFVLVDSFLVICLGSELGVDILGLDLNLKPLLFSLQGQKLVLKLLILSYQVRVWRMLFDDLNNLDF